MTNIVDVVIEKSMSELLFKNKRNGGRGKRGVAPAKPRPPLSCQITSTIPSYYQPTPHLAHAIHVGEVSNKKRGEKKGERRGEKREEKREEKEGEKRRKENNLFNFPSYSMKSYTAQPFAERMFVCYTLETIAYEVLTIIPLS
jgi:hypothetical protein